MPGVADQVGETGSRFADARTVAHVSLFRNGVQPEVLRSLVPAAGVAPQGWLVRSPLAAFVRPRRGGVGRAWYAALTFNAGSSGRDAFPPDWRGWADPGELAAMTC